MAFYNTDIALSSGNVDDVDETHVDDLSIIPLEKDSFGEFFAQFMLFLYLF